jgi:hypothetical protein
MSATKERPLPLVGDLATKARLGRKTQSRRPVNMRDVEFLGAGGAGGLDWDDPRYWGYAADDGRSYYLDQSVRRTAFEDKIRSPYGGPGDRVWIRERARIVALRGRHHVEARVEYADGTRSDWFTWPTERLRWMPRLGHCIPNGCIREAARTVVTLAEVRVERVQDITENDAWAEGVFLFWDRFPSIGGDQRITSGELVAGAPYRASFAVTWDGLYGDDRERLWIRNPYVWVYRWEPHQPSEQATEADHGR